MILKYNTIIITTYYVQFIENKYKILEYKFKYLTQMYWKHQV